MFITDKQRLEKLEKWDMMMTLMGFDYEERTADDWSSRSGEEFMEKVEWYENLMKELADPSPLLSAIIRGHEMGITMQDMYDYHEHLEILEEQRIQEERNELDRTHPTVVKLKNKTKLKLYNSERYPSHKCFDFTVNGIKVTGEVWSRQWNDLHVRLYWVDKNGKKQKQSFNGSWYSFEVPPGFPDHWGIPTNTTANLTYLAHFIPWILCSLNTRKKYTRLGIQPIE